MTDRETVVIWMTKIEGGKGHFGIDLTLDDGNNPCNSSEHQPYCCGSSYYRCPNFGPDAPSFEHGIWIGNTHDDGTIMNFAKRLRRADIEVYTRSKVERRSSRGEIELWPQFPYVRTDTSSFNWFRHGRHYSSHIGEIILPEINYDSPNYGSFHGFIMHNDERVTGYKLRIGAFGTGSPHARTNTVHPLWGFGVFGNADRGRYYTSAPVLRGHYNLNLSLTSPDGCTAHRRGYVNASRPNVPVTIRVEHFFPDTEFAIDTLPHDEMTDTESCGSSLLADLNDDAANLAAPLLLETKEPNDTLLV